MQLARPSANQSPDAEHEIPVLIVGGSLVGLSAALFLRWHGIDSLTVERHAGTAIRARAGHFHLRTIEILRSVGLEVVIRRTSEAQYHPDGGINNVESLAGREIGNFIPNLNTGVAEFSPTVRMFINQDALEPIIRAGAEELGAQLRYHTECTSLTQDADGVTAVLSNLDSGMQTTVRARYVIAADGNRSPIRRWLGIGMHGHGPLSNSITIYFRTRCDLGPLLAGRNQGVHYVTNPVLRGFFRLDRSGNAGFLSVNLVGDISRPEIVTGYPSAPWANVADGITEQRALELLRAAIGVPDFPVEIDDIATWRAVADGADRYQDGHGRPGSRAPHVWLDRHGARLSTLDLLGRNFVLLAGPQGFDWCTAARQAAGLLGLTLDAHLVGGNELADTNGGFADGYGISATGAVVVRPDGFIGWRALDGTGCSAEMMARILGALLCREPDVAAVTQASAG